VKKQVNYLDEKAPLTDWHLKTEPTRWQTAAGSCGWDFVHLQPFLVGQNPILTYKLKTNF